ncbi:MAG: O-antigen ligase family protein [Leptolyngbyaceae cyanobacterium]
MLKTIERLVVILAIVHYSTDWLALIVSGGASEGDGRFVDYARLNLSLNVFINLFTYFWATCFLIFRWKKTLFYLTKSQFIYPVVLIAFASILWSFAPEITLNSSVNLLGISLFGIYVGTNYSLREQVKLFGISYFIILASSLFFIIALPHYGIMGGLHTGAWRGITTHKNTLGRLLAFGIPLLLIWADMNLSKKWLIYTLLAVTALSLIMNRSTGAALTAIVLLASYPIYKIFRLNYVNMLFGLVGLTASISLLYIVYLQNAEDLLRFVGKDPTLTGRTDIWAAVWRMIQQKPWLGYGLDAVWRSGASGPAGYVMGITEWDVPYSHNAWLDLLLSLGFMGLLVYLIGFTLNLFRSVHLIHETSSSEVFLPLLVLTFILIATMADGNLIGGYVWLLYTATFTGVSKFYVQAKNDNQNLNVTHPVSG